ncbi:hypothetical protein H072_2165 [Dactylellina haptotyla CBS 200.50]|uniref:Anaphase-promoting complex subunit 11 RING-H2 finger domain-containing protein n=1 Tax=Dactylellina haptotyla (strain CBS 200.50) TaxID=1284197 RepID=S8ALQ9_DACHA|nr:hypothetical protein H072_2165 [Dactylellina haptotyla CBS 200.50]
MSTPQPIPPRLAPSAAAAQRNSPSPSLPAGSSRPPTAGSMDPPTPRPSQLPFPGADPQPSTISTATITTTTTEDYTSTATTQHQLHALQQQQPFIPFFTLIQDATTSSHFHPTVRYVFSDDEFDPLAILPPPPHHPPPNTSNDPSGPNSLSNSNTTHNNPGTSAPHSGSGSQADVDSNGSGQFGKTPRRTNNERIILVDIGADGQAILSAHSLSPEWQISGVTVAKAPTWMSDEGSTTTAATTATTDGGLMLTIEGVGRGRRKPQGTGLLDGVPGAGGKEKKGTVETLEELVGFYQERLERLQGVVDWAEGRKGVEGDLAGVPPGGGEVGS